MRLFVGLGLILMALAAHAQEASTYTDNMKMRSDRRIGVGVEVGGESGLLGGLLELNMEDENAATIGLGFGNTFQSFSVNWKHSFEGNFFTPYTTVGYSHWYGNGGHAPSSHVLDEMLNSDEKSTDRFGLDLAVAGAGVQYQELSGDFQGTSFFGELDMAVAPFRGKVMPTAAIGATYFF